MLDQKKKKNGKNVHQKMLNQNEIRLILILKKLPKKTAKFVLLLLF